MYTGDEIDAGPLGLQPAVGPMVTMAVLSSAGLANISDLELSRNGITTCVRDCVRKCLPLHEKSTSNGITAIIIVVGFCLGANMSFGQILEGGLPGILLGVITTLVGGIASTQQTA